MRSLRDVGKDLMSIFQLHLELRVGQLFNLCLLLQ